MIRLTRPSLGEEELAAVREVLASGMLVQGARVAAFEEALAARTDRAHAVAVSSGTSALHLALAALEIGPGDEVLVPDLTWPSPAHAVRLVGATPILVDVDPAEWNVRGRALAAARTERTRAAIVVDQFGVPARSDEIDDALRGVPIIEDAACALGSRFAGGSPCGSMGIIACLSFHPRKVLTTGEGGACLTDDPALATRLQTLRNHGQTAPGRFSEAAGNHRLTEIQGAIGLVQLERLDGLVVARRAHADAYRAALPELAFQTLPSGASSNVQTLGALLPETWSTSARDDFLTTVRARGVEVGLLSYALHRLTSVGPTSEDDAFPHASAIVDRGFALPLDPALTPEDRAFVIETVRAAIAAGPR